MARSESPELVDLFTTYTASPESIGAHLAAATARGSEHDPLLVVTGTDIALYPGGGKAPVIQPYRLGNYGFKELAGISHFGPALASLARLREIGGDPGEWRADATRLLAATQRARTANSAGLWRDTFAIRAFAGREERIAALVDYSCLLAERFLRRALDDPGYLTMESVRGDFLAGPAAGLPVPFNKIMIATFYLTGMDIAHRLITWFDAAGIDWSWFEGVRTVGLTAGASAPEALVEGVLDAMREHFDLTVSEGAAARETVTFKLPRALAS